MGDHLEICLIIYKFMESEDFKDVGEHFKKKLEEYFKFSRIDYLGKKHAIGLEEFLTKHPDFKQSTLPSLYKKYKELYHNELMALKEEEEEYSYRTTNILKAIEQRRLKGIKHLEIPTDFYSKNILYRRIFGHLAPVYCVAFDITGQFIFTGADDNLIKLWSARDGRLLSTLRGHNGEITDLSINPQNRLLASGSIDKDVRIWDLTTVKMIACLNAHNTMITSVKFSPQYNHLLSTSKDGTVILWTYNNIDFTFTRTRRFLNGPTVCTSFSTGGAFLACGGSNHYVYFYRLLPGYGLHELNAMCAHDDLVDSIQFCHKGARFATGSTDGIPKIWSYKNSKWQSINLVSKDPIHNVNMVHWSTDDKYLLTSSSDYSIRVWLTKNGELVHTLVEHESDCYLLEPHPSDSRIFVTAGHDGKVIIWDIEKGIPLKIFQNQVDGEQSASLYDLKFSPDGSMFVVTDSYGHLSIFGLGSDEPYQAIPDEMFFNYDYRGLVRDSHNFVIDEQTHMPPHLMSHLMCLVDMNGNPHPQEYQHLVPCFTSTDVIPPLGQIQLNNISELIIDHSRIEDEEYSLGQKVVQPQQSVTFPKRKTNNNAYRAVHRTTLHNRRHVQPAPRLQRRVQASVAAVAAAAPPPPPLPPPPPRQVVLELSSPPPGHLDSDNESSDSDFLPQRRPGSSNRNRQHRRRRRTSMSALRRPVSPMELRPRARQNRRQRSRSPSESTEPPRTRMRLRDRHHHQTEETGQTTEVDTE